MMEKFAELFNKLQSVIQVVGKDISFPQIVVVGSQSDGKSSVLESIVKIGFLPRGSGVVTRTPIILQLKNAAAGNTAEYAEVSYAGGEGTVVKLIQDFKTVAAEIQSATAVLAGTSRNIVNKPITVTVCSAGVPDLTLVDLPGLVENPAGDQPRDIREQVEILVREYVENPSAIILAVHQATTDLANSKSLNLARQVDPDGKRTICVVTKLDMAQTDLTKLLNGHDIAEHHTKVQRVIGVINRSQANAENAQWTNDDQERFEDNFFRKYKAIASEHGARVLSDYLSQVFREHIRKCMPTLKAAVDELAGITQTKLVALGKDVSERAAEDAQRDPSTPDPQHAAVVKVITGFCNFLTRSIDGDNNQGGKEIRGGAKLEELFNTTYWDALQTIDPLHNVTEQETWTQIRNSGGAQRQMFLSTKAFNFLVQDELQRMREESLRCVGLAHKEMLSMRDFAGDSIKDVRDQFPNLYARVNDIVAGFLEQKLQETKEMVEHCVLMQVDYINVKHPDFLSAERRAAKRFNEVAAVLDNPHKDNTNENTTPNNGPARTAPAPATPGTSSLFRHGTLLARERPERRFSDDSEDEDKSDAPFRRTAPKGPQQGPVVHHQHELSKKDKLECQITTELVKSYFDVIRSIVRDSVPKVIMRFMVNEVKLKLMDELLTHLSSREVFAPLLKESETTASRRKNLKDKLAVYQQAAQLVRELSVA